MALVAIEEAAARLGIPVDTLEGWAKQGQLKIEDRRPARLVDPDEASSVADSLGWLALSAENWDDVED